MRKIISINIDIEKVQRLDQYVIRPCSRSDVINDLIGFALNSPYVIEAFVKSKLDELKIQSETSVNNS